jgi:hypothetical protein
MEIQQLKYLIAGLLSVALLGSSNAFADDDIEGTALPPQDLGMTITIDKSLIHGSLAHDTDGNLLYDKAGNARFQYSGTIYAVQTDRKDGSLKLLSKDPIGDITGEAAFPKEFVALSAGVNGLMQQMADGTWDGIMPKMPSVVRWTCNHCDMTVAGTRYVSIVDVLDPTDANDDPNPLYNPQFAAAFDASLLDGAVGALDTMRMEGRAFTGFGPTSFDVATRTMGIRMAGCSALVAVSGPNAGKIGTLCMNAIATFDVHAAFPVIENGQQVGYDPKSAISADGSSNCVTVMQPLAQ